MTDNTTTTSAEQPQVGGPPMPGFMFKIMNPLVGLLLRTPLHGLVSEDLMLLTFTGRKTGREYSTPVGYVRQGDEVSIFTHSPWWKNLRDGAPVKMRIQGQTYQGKPEIVENLAEIKSMALERIEKHGAEMADRMGFGVSGPEASLEEVRQATQGTIFIRIQIQNGER